MTVIVSILCEDGVVIGSDGVETFGVLPALQTIEQPSIKIQIIGGQIITATTGYVGHAQRLNRILKVLWSRKGAQGGLPRDDVIEAGIRISQEVIQDLRRTSSALQNDIRYGWQLGALVAIEGQNKPQLISFDPVQFQPELKGDTDRDVGDRTGRIVSYGSGQAIADPFLGFLRRVLWTNRLPNVEEAALAVTWTLRHVIDLNTGGIGGQPQLAVLQKKGRDWKADLVDTGQLLQQVGQTEEAIAKCTRSLLSGDRNQDAPRFQVPNL